MNEESMPGAGPADQDLNRRWREQSAEEPSSLVDARIRAAARQAIADSSPSAGAMSRRSRWVRFMPLAAAASVALLAVGLVRMIPRGAYEAMPVAGPAQPGPHEPTPASTPAPSARATPEAARAREAPPVAVIPDTDVQHPRFATPLPDAREQTPRFAGESLSREQAHTPQQPAPATQPEGPRADEAAAPRAVTAEVLDADAPVERSERQAKASEAPISTATSRAMQSAPAAAAREEARRPGADEAVPAIPETLAAQVRIDAAQRAGVDPASIRIVAVEPAAWLDSSLGCGPQPESAQVPRVAGYVVTVEVPGTALRYHTDDRDRIAVCEGK